MNINLSLIFLQPSSIFHGHVFSYGFLSPFLLNLIVGLGLVETKGLITKLLLLSVNINVQHTWYHLSIDTQ